MRKDQSIKSPIKRAFLHNTFRNRTPECINNMLTRKVGKSDTLAFLPEIDKVEVEKIDDTHDKWILCYEDGNIECIVTWKPSIQIQGQVVLAEFE